jgi:hypothetical protein
MYHSQLKIKYPDCPFVWDYDDMTKLFSPEIKRMTKESLLQEINNHMVDYSEETRRQDSEYRDILMFLINLTDNSKIQNVYDKINYVSVSQQIPGIKKNMWINFHTTIYCDQYDKFMSKELDAQIAWILVPLFGDTATFAENNYMIRNNDDETVNQREMKIHSELDPMTYKINKNQYQVIEAQIKNLRVAKRNYIKRSDDPVNLKDDILESGSESALGSTLGSALGSGPRFKQIELNNNTRASAGLIRERLNSKYKMNRMRNNPESMDQQKQINMSLKNISQKINQSHVIRELEKESNQHIVTQDQFDYIHDRIVIQRVNQILKFGPNTTGRIRYNVIKNQSFSSFITILRYGKNLHVTLHRIKFT